MPSENSISATVRAPFRSILGFSVHESVVFYSWFVLIGIYLVLYFVLPISLLNSSNGFKSGYVVMIWSVVIFSIIIMAYVVWNHSAACKSKRQKALYYLQGRKASPPKSMIAAIENALDKNMKEVKFGGTEKVPIDWTPLKPETMRPKRLPF